MFAVTCVRIKFYVHNVSQHIYAVYSSQEDGKINIFLTDLITGYKAKQRHHTYF